MSCEPDGSAWPAFSAAYSSRTSSRGPVGAAARLPRAHARTSRVPVAMPQRSMNRTVGLERHDHHRARRLGVERGDERLVDPAAGERQAVREATDDVPESAGPAAADLGATSCHRGQSSTTRLPALRSAYCSAIQA